MVTRLQQPAYGAFIVAGLPSFATLSTIAERIAPTIIASMSPLPSPSPRRTPLCSHVRQWRHTWTEWGRNDVTTRVEADLLSPGGTSDDGNATRRVCITY
jgi:hypothetical protein